MSLIVLVLLLLAGCGGDDGEAAAEDERRHEAGAVRVTSFEFTESRILGELYAQALEGAGVPVRRMGALASREIVEPALEQGAVDLVPEYTGSAIEFLNRGAGRATSDPATNEQLLREAFAERGVEVLAAARAQNQNAVAVTRRTAERLGLATVSDLAPHAGDLVFGGPPECAERPFCLGGLQGLYGLRFKDVKELDAAGPLTIGALEGEEIDVGLLFTTSPQVAPKDFVLLRDDKALQPADNVVPVVRREVTERHGDGLRRALDAVSAHLTTEELTSLIAAVELHGRRPEAVARAWLQRHDLPAG